MRVHDHVVGLRQFGLFCCTASKEGFEPHKHKNDFQFKAIWPCAADQLSLLRPHDVCVDHGVLDEGVP